VTRAAVRTALVTVASLAVVVGVGFALQVASLGRPPRDSLIVLRTVRTLVAYHRSTADETIGGRRLSTRCSQRWGTTGHRATVAVAGGASLVETGDRLAATTALDRDEFALAGCPRPLARWLALALSKGKPLDVRAARFAGRPVFTVVFAGVTPRLRVDIPRSGGLPVALSIVGDGLQGASRVEYGEPRRLAVLNRGVER
jgi:hypothetical protein